MVPALKSALLARGVPRREFLRFCGLMVSTLALPASFVGQVAKALESRRRPVLVWLEFQDCAGNSESLLRSPHPTVTEIVLNLLSLEYHETIMAGAGKRAEAALKRVPRRASRESIIAVVEGAIPTAEGGIHCTIGGRTALDIVREVCPNGGGHDRRGCLRLGRRWLVGAAPNPDRSRRCQRGGPRNHGSSTWAAVRPTPSNTAAVADPLSRLRELCPDLDSYGRPLFAYGELDPRSVRTDGLTIDAGRFVEKWGDDGPCAKGWCLYQDGMQGSRGDLQLPDRPLERPDQLARQGLATAASAALPTGSGTRRGRVLPVGCQVRSRVRGRRHRRRTSGWAPWGSWPPPPSASRGRQPGVGGADPGRGRAPMTPEASDVPDQIDGYP